MKRLATAVLVFTVSALTSRAFLAAPREWLTDGPGGQYGVYSGPYHAYIAVGPLDISVPSLGFRSARRYLISALFLPFALSALGSWAAITAGRRGFRWGMFSRKTLRAAFALYALLILLMAPILLVAASRKETFRQEATAYIDSMANTVLANIGRDSLREYATPDLAVRLQAEAWDRRLAKYQNFGQFQGYRTLSSDTGILLEGLSVRAMADYRGTADYDAGPRTVTFILERKDSQWFLADMWFSTRQSATK